MAATSTGRCSTWGMSLKNAFAVLFVWFASRVAEIVCGTAIITVFSYFFPFFGSADISDKLYAAFAISVFFMILGFYLYATVFSLIITRPVLKCFFLSISFFANSIFLASKAEYNTDFQDAYWLLVAMGVCLVALIDFWIGAWRKKKKMFP